VTRQTQKYCLPVAKAPSLFLGENQAPFGGLCGKNGLRLCTSWRAARKIYFTTSIMNQQTFKHQ